MIVTAWNNGAHNPSGAGYGLKITNEDRDRHFHSDWEVVILELEDYPHSVEVNVNKKSFWGPVCRELISKDIGIWLRENGLAPWPKKRPPKLDMRPVGDRRSKVGRTPLINIDRLIWMTNKIRLGRVNTEFGGYIDLLCLDGNGDTAIVELKRSD